jgi:hypothetical protein
MRTAPTDPTAALAALISANHRHVASRAKEVDVVADAAQVDTGAGAAAHGAAAHGAAAFGARTGAPYLAAITSGVGGPQLATAFELSQESLSILQAGGVGTSAFEIALAAPGIVLLLVVVRLLGARSGTASSEFSRAETEAIMQLETVLRQSPVLRSRLEARKIRAVAIALDASTGRVHWLGEHPGQVEILKTSR